jgi:AbiU2
MTNISQDFESELELFRTESESAAQFFYGYLAIHEVAKRRKEVFQLFNANAMFWMTVSASLQTAALLAIGRIFDQGSPHNLDRLLRLAESNREIFSKAALENRKQGNAIERPAWLNHYLEDIPEPSIRYFRNLRTKTKHFRRIYESKYRELRHKVYAHRAALNQAEIDRIVAKTNIVEFERLFLFLLSTYESLWELYMNGRGSRRRRLRYSVKPTGRLRVPRTSLSSVHERMILDTERALVRAARPNQRIEPTRIRRRSRAAHS